MKRKEILLTLVAVIAFLLISCSETVTYSSVVVISDGTLVDMAVVKENSGYTLPESPEREGYTFSGWKINGGDDIHYAGETVTVAGNTRVTAVWTKTTPETVEKCMVVAVFDNAVVDITFVDEGSVYTLPYVTREGYVLDGWKENGKGDTFTPGNGITISSDTTIRAVWRKTATVIFDTGGVKDIEPVAVPVGESVNEPDGLDKSGFDLSWIKEDGTTYSFDSAVKKNITLTAVWKYHEYNVGDTGPAGGYIFYDCDKDNESGNADGLKSEECGWRYLESAPKAVELLFSTWGSDGDFATASGIGEGKNNSEKLLEAAGKDTSLSFPIVRKSDEYVLNGFDDWFLPSIDEVNAIRDTLGEKYKSKFFAPQIICWSSTTKDTDKAYMLPFDVVTPMAYSRSTVPSISSATIICIHVREF